jgi:hypothetical protein
MILWYYNFCILTTNKSFWTRNLLSSGTTAETFLAAWTQLKSLVSVYDTDHPTLRKPEHMRSTHSSVMKSLICKKKNF